MENREVEKQSADARNVAPGLPTEIGHAGANVWAWADAMSRHTQRRHRERELSASIFRAGIECGSCRYWMTRDCPREKSSITGYNQGPTARALKCGQFVMQPGATQMVAKWQAELAALSDGGPEGPSAKNEATA